VDRLLRERPAPSRAVSCAYARFDPGSGTLRFCGAGTCVALLAGRREVTVLQSGGGALGRGEGASLDEQVVAMEPGDRLVLYTDGVPKSEGPGGETLGAVRIEAVLRARTAPYSAQDLVEAIRGDIAEFTEGAPPPDDRTLVCLVVDGVPPEGQG
jgi:sigma-B regulation protein RsbU (phosphoserine phosphatase)